MRQKKADYNRAQDGERELPVAQATEESTEGMPRRDVMKLLGAASLAVLGLGAPEIARAAEYAQASQGAPVYRPIFFTKAEWPMVQSLAEQVIPKDARSGGAIEAGVPEFMDFIMNEYKGNQGWMRDGLKWLNGECQKRFSRGWAACSPAQQREVLTDIAFPKKATPAFKQGAEFFTRFRDLTSSGFWTSRIGIKDIGYMGNITMSEWTGCPEPQLAKIGVSYKMSMKPVRRG